MYRMPQGQLLLHILPAQGTVPAYMPALPQPFLPVQCPVQGPRQVDSLQVPMGQKAGFRAVGRLEGLGQRLPGAACWTDTLQKAKVSSNPQHPPSPTRIGSGTIPSPSAGLQLDLWDEKACVYLCAHGETCCTGRESVF